MINNFRATTSRFPHKRSYMRSKYILAAVVLFSCLPPLTGQPENDNCAGAFLVEDASDWCSEPGAFSLQGADAGSVPPPSCFNAPGSDIWFTFTPFAADVTITIIGSTGANLLEAPEIALYQGTCDGLQELACTPGIPQSNVNSLYFDGLNLGLPHFIRIQSGAGENGSFQFCINNYNPPEEPSSDCPEAAIICSKEPFVVQKLIGPGDNPTEANDASCLNIFATNVEWHSAWFMWTAGSSGSLTFTLNPLNPPDDIDFVVYEFPNGPGNCADKIVLRCMASSCDGPTGLDEASTDFSEPPNCNDPSQDNFLAALSMEAGKTYGIMVNNFSSTGIGFEMEFGGTGEIAGPDAAIAIVPSGPVCIGEPAMLQDASSFPNGNIVGWEWNFGPGASITAAQTPGPHELSWNSAGTKPVLLRLLTNQGCIVSVVRQVEVICCDARYDIQAEIIAPQCPGGNDGAIMVQASNPNAPYSYHWSNGENGPEASGLEAGPHTLTVSDALGCDTILRFELEGPPAFDFDTLITTPGCNGGVDGEIRLEVTGATPPYSFSWENGVFTSNHVFSNLPAGDYSVAVKDANGCEQALDIPLRELSLEILLPNESFRPPSCHDSQDGALTVIPLNGQPPFQYNFNDGNGWTGSNMLEGLGAGEYTVNIQDANLCRGSFTFTAEAPPPLVLDFSETGISCHGATNGRLEAVVEGGSGSYSFLWNDGSRSPVLTALSAGTYQLTATDANGCEIRNTATLYQPSPLVLEVDNLQPVRCHGEASGSILLAASGGSPAYAFAIDGQEFRDSPLFDNLSAGSYLMYVRDAGGCTTSLNIEIGEPALLLVEAGEPLEVILGYEVQLQAYSSGNVISYNWQPAEGLSCSDCPAPVLAPLQTSWYTIQVEDENGCIAADSIHIILSEKRPVYIPNAFSPNDDGRNDYFKAYLGPAARQAVSMRIFNRWGALVFEQENLSPGIPVLQWDGKMQNQAAPSGVYTYIIIVEFIDGKRRRYSGSVCLSR
ncbi:MAG: gliding motility-associated C-terminal domain-containing protein [Phaeodactylibacter sp.]|nr:gliding motility-associated C-terminal domain-containing protein [Phaeodactylibacter sp.]